MTDNNSDNVKIHRVDLISVLRDLNSIIISMDRIGSFASNTDGISLDELISDFVQDWDVYSRLVLARSKLSVPFSDELGADDMDELEREMENIPFWSATKRFPDG